MVSDGMDLAAVAEKAGTLLQKIQDHLGKQSDKNGKVAFPKGFIRTKSCIESTLPLTKNPKHKDSLSKNICYTLIEAGVLQWLLMRTHLGLVARRMVVKEIMRVLGDVCDSLMVDALYGKGGAKDSYKKRTKKLFELGAISIELQRDLDWLWEQRSKVHLWQLEESEYDDDKYGADQHQRAQETYEGLVAALNSWDN